MAWIEKTGQRAWRVLYQRDRGHYGSISGFCSKTARRELRHDLEPDQRRGEWIDPVGCITTSGWSYRR